MATAGSSTVTWWSDIWSQLNSLSGGTPPAAFKGFAGVTTLPSQAYVNTLALTWTHPYTERLSSTLTGGATQTLSPGQATFMLRGQIPLQAQIPISP